MREKLIILLTSTREEIKEAKTVENLPQMAFCQFVRRKKKFLKKGKKGENVICFDSVFFFNFSKIKFKI